MKSRVRTVLLILILVVGLALILYPTLSDQWNSRHATKAVTAYSEKTQTLDTDVYKALIDDANEYNSHISERRNPYILSEQEKELYPQLLNPEDNGVMGYIDIPAISCTLPIYHGTGDDELQVGVGHLDWSSLPVGGESTHCVLSGHRGLPSAKLFSNLDKLTEGDRFMIGVLNETLTYEVDQIRIVLPDEIEDLKIIEGGDYCTLFTCTPYGINSHRLLVRGHRVENAKNTVKLRIVSDAVQVEPMIVALAIGAPLFAVLITLVSIPERKNRRKRI